MVNDRMIIDLANDKADRNLDPRDIGRIIVVYINVFEVRNVQRVEEPCSDFYVNVIFLTKVDIVVIVDL